MKREGPGWNGGWAEGAAWFCESLDGGGGEKGWGVAWVLNKQETCKAEAEKVEAGYREVSLQVTQGLRGRGEDAGVFLQSRGRGLNKRQTRSEFHFWKVT